MVPDVLFLSRNPDLLPHILGNRPSKTNTLPLGSSGVYPWCSVLFVLYMIQVDVALIISVDLHLGISLQGVLGARSPRPS